MRPRTPGRIHIDPLLGSLGKDRKIVFFRKNQIIFSHGDSSNSIFYIQTGSVKLTVTSKQGKEAVIVMVDGGRFFGDDALAFDRPPRSSHAIALTDVRAMRINPDAMLRLVHTDEDACDAVISSLNRLNAQIIGNCADSLLYFAEERLTRALSAVGRLYEDSDVRAVPRLSQQDLADMIGVSRQRVNVLLTRLKKHIDYDAGVRVYRSILKVAGTR